MKLAIMQPYLFPYIGYYQLVAAVDTFVLYDDVNYIKGGWINRNRLVISGSVKYFTVPLMNASSFVKIKDIKVRESPRDIKKLLDSIRFSYSKSPYFNNIYPLIESIFITETDSSISSMAARSIKLISDYIGLNTQFKESSVSYENTELSAVERVLDICKKECASEYFNLPGGSALYDTSLFERNGVKLSFITPNLTPYTQNTDGFIPGLSILDILMFNDRERVNQMVIGAGNK